MTTWVRQNLSTGHDEIVNMNLPASSEDPDDHSPLYAAMLKRIKELGLADDSEPVRIARLLRHYEDMGLDWLDYEGYPDPDDDDHWEREDARIRADDWDSSRI